MSSTPSVAALEPEVVRSRRSSTRRHAPSLRAASAAACSNSGWTSPRSRSERPGCFGVASSTGASGDREHVEVPVRARAPRARCRRRGAARRRAQRSKPASAKRAVHQSNEAMVRCPSTGTPVGVHGEVLARDRSVELRERFVVREALGAHLALEVPVGARGVAPERRDGGVEDAPADPAQLGEGRGHLARGRGARGSPMRSRGRTPRRRTAARARGHLPARARAHRAPRARWRRRLTSQPYASIPRSRSASTKNPVAQPTSSERRHPEVPPQQPGGDVGVRRDPVVGGVPRLAAAVAARVPSLAEVATGVEAGGRAPAAVAGIDRPGLAHHVPDAGRPGELGPGTGHGPPGGRGGRGDLGQAASAPPGGRPGTGAGHMGTLPG